MKRIFRPYQLWVTRNGRYFHSEGFSSADKAKDAMRRLQESIEITPDGASYRAQLRKVDRTGSGVHIMETALFDA